MILTADQILLHRERGDIVLEPFEPNMLGTVSYHFTASDKIAMLRGPMDSGERPRLDYESLPREGFLLVPDSLYLLSTAEKMGSGRFAQRIFGTRSSGSIGLFIDVSADLGQVGCITQWTLELVVVKPLLLFPGQVLGQITFWELMGPHRRYDGSFQGQTDPRPSALWKERNR